MKKINLCLLFLLLLPCSLLAKEKLNIVSPEWDTFVNKDKTGIYIEIISSIFESQGYEIELLITPYARSLDMIQNNNADMMFGTYSRETLDKQGFNLNLFTPNYPINIEKTAAILKKNKLLSGKGKAGLKNQKVIAIRGYGYDKVFDIPMDYLEINRHNQAFKMLESGRADIFIDDAVTMKAYIKESRIDTTPYRMEVLKVDNLYIALPNNEHGRKLGAIFDKGMIQLIESGAVARIFQGAGIEVPVLVPEKY